MSNLPAVKSLSLPGVLLISPVRHVDARGFFSESYNESTFHAVGVTNRFVQDNHSLSRQQGTVRGLHFQIPPYAQAKLVRVLRGAIFDVAVDIRSGSATFGKSASALLSAENGDQLFVPAGFAHGYCTLEPDTEVLYKVDAAYLRDCERGLLWNDHELGISWPEMADPSTLLERDQNWQPLRSLPVYF